MDANRFVKIELGQSETMEGYLSHPSGSAKGGIVVVQEVFGVTRAMRDIADDLAREGYLVLVPDLFWRLEPRAELGNGEDAELRAKALSLLGHFDVERGASDLRGCAAYLRSLLPDGFGVGIVGFCIGGRMAALVAADGGVDAASAFYGVGLDKYVDRLAGIRIPVQFHFGETDTHIPKATVDTVKSIVDGSGNPDAAVHTYPGAGHAFYNRHRVDSFSAPAAAEARERLVPFLAAHLRAPGSN